MAKKIKFPLEFSNGVKVRTLEELQQYADVESILRYYHNEKLKIWLEARDYHDIVSQIISIDTTDASYVNTLCNILGIEYENLDIEVHEIQKNEKKLNRLRRLTSDEKILANVENVVFNQQELDELVKKDIDIVYLSNNENQIYVIDESIKNIKYIGLFGNPQIHINVNRAELLNEIGISFQNIILPEYLKSYWRSTLDYKPSNCDFDLDCKVNIVNSKKLYDIIKQEFSFYQYDYEKNLSLEFFRERVCALQYWWDNNSSNKCYEASDLFEVNIFTPNIFFNSRNKYVEIILSELAPDQGQKIIFLQNSRPIKLSKQYKYRSLKEVFEYRWFNCLKKRINELPIINDNCGFYIGLNIKNIGTREYRLIFWWLVFIALDTELYHNHMSYVSDIADLFGFNHYMMQDWCKVVRYWLDGNTINKKNLLNLKTKEARSFFLNR